MIQFRRDKRDPERWNVFGPATEVRVGEVTITKKSGETQKRRVVGVSRPFDVDGVPHVYGYLEERPKREERAEQPAGETAEASSEPSSADYDEIPF